MNFLKILVGVLVVGGLAIPSFNDAQAAVSAETCNKCYVATTQNCKIGEISNKVNINEGEFMDKCEKTTDDALIKNITTCAKNAKPDSDQCNGNFSVFLSLYQNVGSNAIAVTEVEKCAKELVGCASLLQACDGTLGQINITNLNEQCKFYLQGVGGKWNAQLGAGLCAQVLGIKKPLAEKCTDYKATVNALKDGCVCSDNKTTKNINAEGKDSKTAAKECCTACTGSSFVNWKAIKYSCAIEKKVEITGITKFPNPVKSSIGSPQEFLGNVIKTVLGIVGTIAFALIVYGGFMWMVSAGNGEKVKMGQQTILWAALGLVAISVSYAIVSFIIENLG